MTQVYMEDAELVRTGVIAGWVMNNQLLETVIVVGVLFEKD